MHWFEVDKEGLAKILERRGKAFALLELVSNAFDTNARSVVVKLAPIDGRPLVEVSVADDDPDGFHNLAHAWTLFAESNRKGDAEKRGRFNLGEKLVLAICEEAEIFTKSGAVRFDAKGRHRLRRTTSNGSVFNGVMRMTRAELAEAEDALRRLLVPEGVAFRVNGVDWPKHTPVLRFTATLPTEVADADGNLKRTERKAEVSVYEVGDAHGRGWLYELGIPVVETGDRFHVNVGQKVPLNMDRDNVLPSFLARLRAEVLNHVYPRLTHKDVTTSWVKEAIEHSNVAPEAVRRVVQLQHGERAVIADPSDPEGTKIAVTEGYTVVPGGTYSAAAWENIKRAEALLPAGKVTPSPKPFSKDGEPLKVVPREDWTPDMVERAYFINDIAKHLLPNREVYVTIANDIGWPFAACYGKGGLTLNLGRLGHAWFALPHSNPEVLRLLIHEFAHERVSDHLSSDFHEECCRLGAKLVELALTQPELFSA